MVYFLRPIPGIRISERRAVVFLESSTEENNIDAHSAYLGFAQDLQRGINKAFELFVDGVDSNDRRHHGWDKSQSGGRYTCCHVFKHDQTRLYGIKGHSDTQHPRFEVCALVECAQKTKNDTDESIMKRLVMIAASQEFKRALTDYGCPHGGGRNHEGRAALDRGQSRRLPV